MIPVLTPDRAGNFKVWDLPTDHREYVAGADVAEGKKRDRSAAERRGQSNYGDSRPDYSSISVIELETGLHVASWHGYLPPDQFATTLAAVGYYYNTALLVPEINGPGLAVLTRLTETIRYPNIYRSRIFNVLDMDPMNPSLGWRTDMHSRKILMLRVHEALNSDRLFTRDKRTISELRTMEFDDAGVERGRGKNKDDCVFSLALALQGRYDAIGNSQPVVKNPRSSAEAFEAKIWDRVEENQKRIEDARRRLGGGLYSGWGTGRRPGRAH